MQNCSGQHPSNDPELTVLDSPVTTAKPGSKIMKNLLICFGLILAASDLAGQSFDLPARQNDKISVLRVPAYIELGQNNITDGIYLKTAMMPAYEYGHFGVQAGVRFDIISNNQNVLSGFSLIGSGNFLIGNIPLDVQGLYILSRYLDVLHETNWGLLLKTRTKHFKISLGTSFRTLALNNEEAQNLNDTINTRIHENWNMIYSFSYYIKPLDNDWNINFSVTNIDYFNLSQETNPIFKIGAQYAINPTLSLFIDTGYESSGITNMNTDFFGFYFKTGIIWNIW